MSPLSHLNKRIHLNTVEIFPIIIVQLLIWNYSGWFRFIITSIELLLGKTYFNYFIVVLISISFDPFVNVLLISIIFYSDFTHILSLYRCFRMDIQTDCPICLATIQSSNSNLTLFGCGHIFHTKCINKYQTTYQNAENSNTKLCCVCRYRHNNVYRYQYSSVLTDTRLFFEAASQCLQLKVTKMKQCLVQVLLNMRRLISTKRTTMNQHSLNIEIVDYTHYNDMYFEETEHKDNSEFEMETEQDIELLDPKWKEQKESLKDQHQNIKNEKEKQIEQKQSQSISRNNNKNKKKTKNKSRTTKPKPPKATNNILNPTLIEVDTSSTTKQIHRFFNPPDPSSESDSSSSSIYHYSDDDRLFALKADNKISIQHNISIISAEVLRNENVTPPMPPNIKECGRCTFHNSDKAKQCKMCGSSLFESKNMDRKKKKRRKRKKSKKKKKRR